jgi:phytanoyl-CoA dioxygenase PhyH
VTAEPETRFQSNGWDLIPGFLDQTEVGRTAASLNEVLSLPRPPCMTRPGNDLVPLRWNDRIVARILDSPWRMQRVLGLLHARDLKWLSGYVSTKAPYSPALWWHQDWWCWDHPVSLRRSATQVAVLCYLTQTSETNGAVRLLPGSHLKSTAMHAQLPEPHGEYANGLSLDHPAMIDSPGQVTVPVNAGDAVLLDYRLLHGTHANASPQRRDCVLLSFIPDWAGLPPELKAHLIAHPALPDEFDGVMHLTSGYVHLLPNFVGTPTDLAINRLPPTVFSIE